MPVRLASSLSEELEQFGRFGALARNSQLLLLIICGRDSVLHFLKLGNNGSAVNDFVLSIPPLPVKPIPGPRVGRQDREESFVQSALTPDGSTLLLAKWERPRGQGRYCFPPGDRCGGATAPKLADHIISPMSIAGQHSLVPLAPQLSLEETQEPRRSGENRPMRVG